MPEKVGPLDGVRVLDLTDERGIYGAKLLADLGADVVRPEPPDGDPLRKRGPHLANGAQDSSLWYAFFASTRRFVTIDLDLDVQQFLALVKHADILLTCTGSFGVAETAEIVAQRSQLELVHVDISSFGDTGPWRDFLAPDLVAGALGGAAATTGDQDTPPLKGFGELNFMVAGAYAAIAALAALFYQRASGSGQRVGVPVHDCIASCLEHVFMFYWFEDLLKRKEGKVLPRRASLHWSDLYQVMQAQTGSIMVTPAPDYDAQLVWLIEEEAFQDLIDPKYDLPENLMLRGRRCMEVMREWVATKDAELLFNQAQARHAPYGWVLPIERVADNPQLQARDWYVPYPVGEQQVSGPGAPYQFSATPWQLGESTTSEVATIMADIGWEESRG
jgi:crotonobetainyl-CoA:carnitine CoA-transferase CaiB-like acyl-CoA transferase